MTDDDRLLDLLGRALDTGEQVPPADRVAALRARVAALRSATPADPASPPTSPAPAPPPAEPVPLRRAPSPPPPPPPPATRPFGIDARHRRAGWVAAGATVAAAAVVVALVAVPALMRHQHRGQPAASASVSGTRDAVARLRVALLTHDPVTVAKADADLLRTAGRLPDAERHLVQDEAVRAHLDAIQFLRDHPSPDALSAAPREPDAGPALSPSTTVAPATPTTLAATAPPGPTTTAAEPTTVASATRTVAITRVSPTLAGTFAVDFSADGFTPDASGAPGTFAVRFSFDDGQAPTMWDGPSPWTFPDSAAIRFHRVCARVVDAAGVEDPASGGCRDILA